MRKLLTKEILEQRLPAGRCSQRDLLIIKSKAEKAGLSVSQYMRHMCVHGSVIERTPLINMELLTQLRRIGVNLNQYVKVFHARSGESPERIEDILNQIEQVLEQVLDGS